MIAEKLKCARSAFLLEQESGQMLIFSQSNEQVVLRKLNQNTCRWIVYWKTPLSLFQLLSQSQSDTTCALLLSRSPCCPVHSGISSFFTCPARVPTFNFNITRPGSLPLFSPALFFCITCVPRTWCSALPQAPPHRRIHTSCNSTV